jgi:hypothetical protein
MNWWMSLKPGWAVLGREARWFFDNPVIFFDLP